MSSALYAIPRAGGWQPIRLKKGRLGDGGYCANSSHMDLSVSLVWLQFIGDVEKLFNINVKPDGRHWYQVGPSLADKDRKNKRPVD